MSSSLVRFRRWLGGHAIFAGCEAWMRTLRWHPASRRLMRGLSVEKDVPYDRAGALPERRLDIYRREDSSGGRPVLLYAHGGGFRILSKNTHWMMAASFAQEDVVVFNVDYRLAPRHRCPAAVEDLVEAACWIAEHANEHGGDPTRWAVAGDSAGAQLALTLALIRCGWREDSWAKELRERTSPLAACLPAHGFHQLSDGERYARGERPVWWFYLDRILEVAEGYAPRDDALRDLMDPLLLLESDWSPSIPLPPMLALCGTRDPIEDDTLRLGRALEARGQSDVVVPLERQYHVSHACHWTRASRQAWTAQREFVRRHLS